MNSTEHSPKPEVHYRAGRSIGDMSPDRPCVVVLDLFYNDEEGMGAEAALRMIKDFCESQVPPIPCRDDEDTIANRFSSASSDEFRNLYPPNEKGATVTETFHCMNLFDEDVIDGGLTYAENDETRASRAEKAGR